MMRRHLPLVTLAGLLLIGSAVAQMCGGGNCVAPTPPAGDSSDRIATSAFAGNAGNLSSGTIPCARMPAHTGDVTTSAGSCATAIAPNAVTNTQLADMPTLRLKGRVTAGTGDPEDLTAAQSLALLNNPQQFYSYQVDLNTVADTTLTFTLPAGHTRYQLGAFRVINTSNTASLNTALVGVFTGAGGTGTAIVTGGSSLAAATTNAAATNGAIVTLPVAVGASAYFTTNPIFFRVTTGQGAGANQATVTVTVQLLSVS